MTKQFQCARDVTETLEQIKENLTKIHLDLIVVKKWLEPVAEKWMWDDDFLQIAESLDDLKQTANES